MLTVTQLELVESLARELTDKDVIDAQEQNKEAIAKHGKPLGEINNEAICRCFENHCNWLTNNAELILGKGEPLAAKVRVGMLHPSNRWSRRLFTGLTGLPLPSGVKESRLAVVDYLGQDVYCNYIQGLQDARDAKEEAKRQAEAQEVAERVRAILDKIRENQQVDGDELVVAANAVGVHVHPRTVGTLRKRVYWITSDRAAMVGKRLPNSVYQVYRAVQAEL